MDVESRKGPDREGLFLEVTLYILDELNARLQAVGKELDKNAIIIPGRR